MSGEKGRPNFPQPGNKGGGLENPVKVLEYAFSPLHVHASGKTLTILGD